MFPFIKETVRIGQLTLNFILDGEDTDGHLVQFELIVPPNAKVPAPHFHTEVDEALYVMEGTLTQSVGTETKELNVGDVCFIKRGVMHGFNNLHPTTARALCTLSPASIGPAYFREIGEVINAGGPPDVTKIIGIMKRHGLEAKKLN
jgi:quercetin dioxygenase-like cupin family protein